MAPVIGARGDLLSALFAAEVDDDLRLDNDRNLFFLRARDKGVLLAPPGAQRSLFIVFKPLEFGGIPIQFLLLAHGAKSLMGIWQNPVDPRHGYLRRCAPSFGKIALKRVRYIHLSSFWSLAPVSKIWIGLTKWNQLVPNRLILNYLRIACQFVEQRAAGNSITRPFMFLHEIWALSPWIGAADVEVELVGGLRVLCLCIGLTRSRYRLLPGLHKDAPWWIKEASDSGWTEPYVWERWK